MGRAPGHAGRLHCLHPSLQFVYRLHQEPPQAGDGAELHLQCPSFGRTASNGARWIAKSTRRHFMAKPMPDLQVPGASVPQVLELRIIA